MAIVGTKKTILHQRDHDAWVSDIRLTDAVNNATNEIQQITTDSWQRTMARAAVNCTQLPSTTGKEQMPELNRHLPCACTRRPKNQKEILNCTRWVAPNKWLTASQLAIHKLVQKIITNQTNLLWFKGWHSAKWANSEQTEGTNKNNEFIITGHHRYRWNLGHSPYSKRHAKKSKSVLSETVTPTCHLGQQFHLNRYGKWLVRS